MRKTVLSLAVGFLLAGVASAQQPAPAACEQVSGGGSPSCCGHCGRKGCCDKYCTVVCEMKEVKKVVWEVKCEEFCAPLPGCIFGGGCGCGCEKGCKCDGKTACCDSCRNNCDPCAAEKSRNYVAPNCGPVRTRQILVKKEVTCKVPSYKCVVQHLCSTCAGSVEQQPVPSTAPAPATAPAAKPQDLPLPPVPDPKVSQAPRSVK
jgi:hypothetical protein